MYTQCPNCNTTFRISIPQLKAAQGKVRCGHCESVFNGLLNLSEELQEIPTINERAGHQPPAENPLGDGAVTTPDLPNLARAGDPASGSLPPTHKATGNPPTPPLFTVIDAADEIPNTASFEYGSTPAMPALDEAVVPLNEDVVPFLDPAPSLQVTPAEPSKLPWEPGPLKPSGAKTRREMIVRAPQKTGDRLRNEEFPTELPIFAPDRRARPRPATADVTDYAALENYLPEETKAVYKWWNTCAWTVGILALLTVLIVQYTYFMREDLAGYATLRPGLEKFCALVTTVAECDLPLRHDLAQIEKSDSAVIMHPKVRDALQVTTTLINKATFPQPYPYFQITLSGIDGAVIAKRRFHPNEYLPANTNLKLGMQPGVAVPILLEVATPSTDFNLRSWSIDLF
ncbi:MAG: DUF3426 domain-containing protein [Gammaproteobacteria bacterium]